MNATTRAMSRRCAGWLILAAVLLLVVALRPSGIDPGRVRAVCEQYAGLDLAGLAPLCVEAGYTGERVYLR